MSAQRLLQRPALTRSTARAAARITRLLVTCCALTLSLEARAAEKDPPPDSALLGQAVEALHQAKLPQAQELLQTVFQKNYEPRVLCLMGQLAKALGRSVQAYDFYHRCLEGGGALDAGLKQEATAGSASPPGRTGEILGFSKKGGFLWVEGLLTARVRPGEPAHIVLPTGKQRLQLGLGAAPFEVAVQPQSVCDVDLDQQQVACSTSILLLPLGPKAPLDLSQPQTASWWTQLATPLRKENGRLVELPRQQTLFSQNPKLVQCLTELSCQVQLGKLADATYVLGLQLDPAPGALADAPKQDYKLRAWLVEARVEKSTVEEQQSCERCSPPELEQAATELVRRVFASGQRPVRRVQISSTPIAGAAVDGTARGLTPLDLWLFPGSHEIRIEVNYFYPLAQKIDVLEDTTDEVQKFALNLRPLPLSKGERAIRYGAWLTGGLSIAALATGIGLYLRPDSPVSPVDDQRGYLLETRTPGIVMMVTGGAMLLSSIVLIAVDRYSQSRRRIH